LAEVAYAEGLVIRWTETEMSKIAEIKTRAGRKPPRDIFVAPNHSLIKEIHREERVSKAREVRRAVVRARDEVLLTQRLMAARARERAVERRHNRSHAIQSLLDSGMSRKQIAETLGLSYGAVVKTLWRWGRNEEKEVESKTYADYHPLDCP
jgi:hypothetical protein